MTDIANSLRSAVKAYLPDDVKVMVAADGDGAFKVRIITKRKQLPEIYPIVQDLVHGDGALLDVDGQKFIIDAVEDQPYLVIKEELGRASTRFIRYSQPDGLPLRSECSCPCHAMGGMHIRPCCRPDPAPDTNAGEASD